MSRYLLILLLITATLYTSGCQDKEMDDVARAQECLDKAQVAGDATRCFDMVAKYDSQQANVIKCSAKFIQGGLLTSRIVTAYKQIEDSTAVDKTALYISLLAFSPAPALTTAAEAKNYCERTGVKGLIFLSNMSYIGTQLSDALGGGGFSTDPTTAQTQIDSVLADCQDGAGSTTGGKDCAELANELSAVIPTIAESYCASESNKDTDVCTKINDAVESGDAGLALLCVIDGKKFCSSNSTCVATSVACP